jgi:hypothetical protein
MTQCRVVTGATNSITLDSRVRQANVNSTCHCGIYWLLCGIVEKLKQIEKNGLYKWKAGGILNQKSELDYLYLRP